MNAFSKTVALLTPRERFHGGILIIVLVLMGIPEVAGIASIMPFIAVLATPVLVESNKWLNWCYSYLDFSSINSFLFFLGVMVIAVLVINNACKAFVSWYIARYTNMCRHSMSRRMLASYLCKPYVFFLNRNTAELGKNVIAEIDKVVDGALRPFIDIMSQGVTTLFIVTLLVVMDPLLAVSIAVALGITYMLIYAMVHKKLSVIGDLRTESNEGRFQTADDALGGIKEIKILGREKSFLDRYSVHSERLSDYHTTFGIVSLVPLFAVEIIAFGGILLIVLQLIYVRHSLTQALPMIALYAFSTKRLMPAFQGIFSGFASIRFHRSMLDVLYKDMAEREVLKPAMDVTEPVAPLPYSRMLRLENISFTYPELEENVIKDLDLAIAARSMIAFVGATGSGKTTLMDIILGLLKPERGCMKVDNEVILDGNIRRWQRNIGYVPQFIYLSDDTVARNIAFGVSDDEIDMKAVERAAKIANVHDFIKELPRGYKTMVGERGVRFSGGERQRIGIARALYHDPEVLILDEATNALDGITEDVIMEAIHSLSHGKTIIMIAHRLTTVKNCDVIYVMDCGHIVAQGKYQELMQTCERFRAMAKMED